MIGLEEVGLTSNTPVSINLHAISLKHVLDLMLEPMELAYTIQNDVLKITNRMRQQVIRNEHTAMRHRFLWVGRRNHRRSRLPLCGC